MSIDEQTYHDLITAFSYKLTLETCFYWKNADKRLVEVSILDYALLSDCKHEYISGLDPEEEREVKEAIIANEKKRDTHLLIPRLSVPERIEIIKNYIAIQTNEGQKQSLVDTMEKLIAFNQVGSKRSLSTGFNLGFDLNNLCINTPELSDDWTAFYRKETIPYLENWLDSIKNDA